MRVNLSPDIFQEKISDLMAGLKFVCTYLDDLLIMLFQYLKYTKKMWKRNLTYYVVAGTKRCSYSTLLASISPDVFQEKMSSIMLGLEFVHMYLDDLLFINNGSFEEHLQHLVRLLQWLRREGLKANAKKSYLFSPEIEYAGYLPTKEVIKPVQMKVQSNHVDK